MKWFAYQYVEIEIINSMVEQLANDFFRSQMAALFLVISTT